MNKTAIKNYAIWARVQLIEAAKQKAYEYAVTDGENVRELSAIGGRLLTETEKKQRRELLDEIRQKGYQQVMEEAAYTWFNRFIALRFMEVNGYLPSRIRVFTDETGAFKPEILKEAMTVELAGLDRAKVLDLLDRQDNDALYQYLLITQCNALNDCLPQMFERIDNWTELLFPKNLLRPDGVLGKMISMIPEEDWTDQVQIIGWLYEAYNTELNAVVYDGTLSKAKIPKELLSAATTIYTPDWPVHYMVENSLGRLWMEGHPNEEMKKSWKYYLEEAEQEPEVQKQLASIRVEYAKLQPEDIKVIDPCMGSGHILVVMFDVLLQIYESCGYSAREAVSLIVEKNLYGLDIDERAAQLAYFAVMMKARQHDRRFFTRNIQPRVYAIRESNNLDRTAIDYFINRDPRLKTAMDTLIRELNDAKEYGSILNVSMVDFAALYARFEEIKTDNSILSQIALSDLLPFAQVAEAIAQKYNVVVTNPPYLGSSRFSAKLDQFVKAHYQDVKSDLSMVMYNRALFGFVKRNGFVAFITTSSWMFLSSFEKMRTNVFHSASICSLVDFGTELFEGKVGHNPIVAWVTRKSSIDSLLTGIRLVDYCYSRRDEKEPEFFNKRNRYSALQSNFSKIPGSPVAYWVSTKAQEAFQTGRILGKIAQPKQGMVTRDNSRFMRLWWEASYANIEFYAKNHNDSAKSCKKWYPCTSGGPYRKWYGNIESVVNFQHDGQEIIAFSGPHIKNREFYFRESITWSAISSSKLSMRFSPDGTLPEHAGNCLFGTGKQLKLLQALTNSAVGLYYLGILSPTLNYNVGDVANIPVIVPKEDGLISSLTENLRALSKADWDSFETSWDFRKHPLVPLAFEKREQEESQWGKHRMESFGKIEWHYNRWEKEAEDRFNQLKSDEEELNRIFIDIYGLQGELTPEVEDKDVTVRKADLQREIRSLISYAVGCMFGRYSLDVPGLAYAGGAWDASKYKTFIPDADAILPICDDEYFEDDIVGRFVKFIEAAYGKDSLEENLKFIADALGGKGTPRQVIRSYFLNDFYADHLKVYQKRPIYWLFDSGKKNGFKCLIYMHRYQPDTIARIRTDYVHEQQERYRSQIQMIEDALQTASTAERVKLNKQLTKFKDQALELQKYEEKIHHLADQAIAIDLDDGVKVNYAKFEDVLAKIK